MHNVTGWDITAIRVTYTPSDDTLSIGLEGPPSGNPSGGQVIAGDADNNGNSGTVNPIISNPSPPPPGLAQGFMDPPDFGGSEHMGAFLDFTGSGNAQNAQIVAGFSQVPPPGQAPKLYEVAKAVPTGPGSAPTFPLDGSHLPQFEGNVYYNNSPNHPNLEFSIIHFSQLYQQFTGHPLSPSSVIDVGGFGGSGEDIDVGEAFFDEQPFTLSTATLPPPPPISPGILINPHEHRVIDTSHRDLVRVYVQGTSGFDVTTINPATVSLDGASPITHFTRHFPHSEFPVATYVFVGSDIHLPAGYTTATFTAQTFNGQQITSSKQVLNIPFSAKVPGRLHFLMDKGSAYPALRRLEATQPSAVTPDNTTQSPPTSVKVNLTSKAAIRDLRVSYRDQVSTTGTTTPVALPRTVVSLAR